VSDIAIFVLKRDVKLQPTNLLCSGWFVAIVTWDIEQELSKCCD